MRKSRVIAFVIASLVSSASLAQAQSATPGVQAGRHEMRGGMQGGRGRHGALMGIKLSDAEKAQLKAIHTKYAEQGKSLREQLKPAMLEARADRQKGDTVAAKAVWTRTQGVRDQMKALHERERGEVRAALTPENQKLFDANVARMTQRRAKWEKDGGRKGWKGGHKGHAAGTNG